MPDRILMADPVVVPVTHSCGHRVEYPWDAWEVGLDRHPDREPCAVCRRRQHHSYDGKPYAIVVNPLTQEVVLWHDGWPFPMPAADAETLARNLAAASWSVQGKPLAANERVGLVRWIDGGSLKPFLSPDDFPPDDGTAIIPGKDRFSMAFEVRRVRRGTIIDDPDTPTPAAGEEGGSA